MAGPSPLSGIRVLDFTRIMSGPFATMILGDLGADVIKVEPVAGDECRFWPPQHEPSGESGYFFAANRNKRSITLNLKDPRGQTVARRLAAGADVVVENFTPGVTEKLGIDPDTLHRLNPGLIYCSVTGFGQTGPYRTKKAYDPIIQGMTGLISITGEKDRPPVKVGIPITDMVAGMYAVIAIQAALRHRDRTGEGQTIDVAMYDASASLLTVAAMQYLIRGDLPQRVGLDHAHRIPAGAFLAKDGVYVHVSATSEVMYPKFCAIIGRPDLATDPRFADHRERLKHADVLLPILREIMLTRTSDEWLADFEAAGLPCGPVLTIDQVFADPHFQARELLLKAPHPTAGEVPQLGFPYKLSRTPAALTSPPPLLGEHTDQVLREELGYDDDAIAQLRRDGVIA